MVVLWTYILQNWLIVTESVRSTKPKIFTLWSLLKMLPTVALEEELPARFKGQISIKFCWLCSLQQGLDLTSGGKGFLLMSSSSVSKGNNCSLYLWILHSLESSVFLTSQSLVTLIPCCSYFLPWNFPVQIILWCCFLNRMDCYIMITISPSLILNLYASLIFK